MSRFLLPFKAEKLVVFRDRCYFFTNKNALDDQSDSPIGKYFVIDSKFYILKKERLFNIELFTGQISANADNDFTQTADGVIHLRDSYDTIFNLTDEGLIPLVKLQFHKIHDPNLQGFEASNNDPNTVWLVVNFIYTED